MIWRLIIFKGIEKNSNIYALLRDLSGDNPEITELIREHLSNMEVIYAAHLDDKYTIYAKHLDEKNQIYEKAIREEKDITPAEEIWKKDEFEQLKWKIIHQIFKKNPYKRFLLREIYVYKVNYPGFIIGELKAGHEKKDIKTVLDKVVEENILQQDDNSFYYLTEETIEELFDYRDF